MTAYITPYEVHPIQKVAATVTASLAAMRNTVTAQPAQEMLTHFTDPLTGKEIVIPRRPLGAIERDPSTGQFKPWYSLLGGAVTEDEYAAYIRATSRRSTKVKTTPTVPLRHGTRSDEEFVRRLRERGENTDATNILENLLDRGSPLDQKAVNRVQQDRMEGNATKSAFKRIVAEYNDAKQKAASAKTGYTETPPEQASRPDNPMPASEAEMLTPPGRPGETYRQWYNRTHPKKPVGRPHAEKVADQEKWTAEEKRLAGRMKVLLAFCETLRAQLGNKMRRPASFDQAYESTMAELRAIAMRILELLELLRTVALEMRIQAEGAPPYTPYPFLD